MRFTIHAPDTSHGIRVIGEIPDEPLCRIEGRNGIGKTLAVHILELCTGQQPYGSRSDAWRTLCEYLGPTTVTIDGLRGPGGDNADHQLRFQFDWRGRADDPMPMEPRRELFDEITFDGDDVGHMDEVRRWLMVTRIAGDETLTETIAGLVAHDRELVRSASRVASDRGRYVDSLFDGLLGPFPREVADQALVASVELGHLSEERTKLVKDREQQGQVVALLEAAHTAREIVSQVTTDAGTLEGEIKVLTAQLESASERREVAEQELAKARDEQRLTQEVEKELASAQRTFTRRLNAIERADEAIAKAAAALGISNDADDVKEALAQLSTDRKALADARADMSELYALRDLLDSVVHALAPAAVGGLRARTVASIGGQPITAGQLLDAVRARRGKLAADAPAVEDLDQSLARLDARERDLESLSAAIAARAEKVNKLTEAEEALRRFGGESDSADDVVAEKAAAKAHAQRVEIEVGSALGAAQRQKAQLGGGLDLEDLRADLDRCLSEAGTSTDALEDDLRKARALLAALDDRLDVADARRDELVAQTADLDRALGEQTRRLQADNAHARLRDVLGDRAPNVGDDSEDQARAWAAVHAAQDRAVLRVQAARGDLDAVVGRMSALVDVIRDKDEASPELDPIRRLYQDRLEGRFRQDEIVSTLFDGGSLTRVDLAAREIRWTTKENEPRVRPFEAFSSGERAFAYVQARLGSVAQVTALNRVVAIDEFGAFLSRDRLVRLQQVVQRQLDEGIIRQAIVVLPMGAVSEIPTAVDAGPELLTGSFDVLAEA